MPLSTDDIRKFVVTELSVFTLRNKPQTWDFALRSLDHVAKDIDDPARMQFVEAMATEGLIVIDKSEPFHTGPIHHLCRVTDEHADHLKALVEINKTISTKVLSGEYGAIKLTGGGVEKLRQVRNQFIDNLKMMAWDVNDVDAWIEHQIWDGQ